MNARNQILAPLLVMILLTLLVGGTAYQQIRNWESGIKRVTNHISELVILNNIHWGLRKVQQELDTNPEQAQITWLELHKQAQMLATLPTSSPGDIGSTSTQNPVLYAILQHPIPERAQIQSLLNADSLDLNMDVVQQLSALEQDAEFTTRLVTVSMVLLGLLLTAITARDLEKLFQKLARSRDLNIQLQEDERRRLAQELHDGVVQELIDLKRQYSPDKVEQVIHNLRRVCHNLKPQVLDDLGLPAALQFLADDLRQAGIEHVKLNLDETGLAQLPKAYELPLFRVIQELCSNMKHHAKATRVNMAISYNPSESPVLSGYVSDNGQGFDPGKVAVTSMGLAGIRERIQQMDGNLKIHSKPGEGTQFQWTIPVKTHAATR
jgi:signal transduction histidine kinase